MKKILILSVFAAIAFVGCKKKEMTVSTVVTVSYPTITLLGPQYLSTVVGGTYTLPAATAWDSFYKKSYTVVKNLGAVDLSTPGLYTITYSAKNDYGFVGTANIYLAVTNVSDTLDLSGKYIRTVSSPNPNRVAFVTKLARGLFMTSNVGGVDITDPTTGAIVSAAFAVLDPTTIDFGSQLTSAGTLTASNEVLSLAPADTTLSYAINLSGFGGQVRTFVKQ